MTGVNTCIIWNISEGKKCRTEDLLHFPDLKRRLLKKSTVILSNFLVSPAWPEAGGWGEFFIYSKNFIPTENISLWHSASKIEWWLIYNIICCITQYFKRDSNLKWMSHLIFRSFIIPPAFLRINISIPRMWQWQYLVKGQTTRLYNTFRIFWSNFVGTFKIVR